MEMGKMIGLRPIVINDFNFEANLDPSLFNVEPPAGYKVQTPSQMKVTGDLGQNVVPVLRAYASHKDGQFPPTLGNPSDLMTTILGNQTGKPDPANAKLFKNIITTSGLLLQLHKGEGWDYFPDGARLGDADMIVLWYRTAGAQSYKAVYGDLHIADITVDQLPAHQAK